MREPADPRYFGPAVLALADGRVFHGQAFGARGTVVGEVVFNTSMTGYQEIVSDPSYAGQLVCLTAVEIGNTGVNTEDDESHVRAAAGLLVRSLSPVSSNWRSERSLHEYLVERQIPGMAEFDTRALTRHLRTQGALMGAMSTEHTGVDSLIEMARSAPSMEGRDLASEVSTDEVYEWVKPTWRNNDVPPADLHVVAYDFGIKQNILRLLRDQGIRVTVVPAGTPVDDVLARKPDGVFLSNGPGDPAALPDVVEQLRRLLDADTELPIFGICLGHQLLCLALGGKTYKLKFGHHGGNHPVRAEADGSVAITAQNHGFAVELESLGERAELTHVNLFDDTVAGMRLRDRPVSSVQYHPEASPGPHDSTHLFVRFAEQLRNRRERASA
jgi:carbamoyl-phosphate synthase small subunit